MSSPEIYKGWLIEARPVFCVQVWSAGGECVIPVHNAKTEEEALQLAKGWIDMQMDLESPNQPEDDDNFFQDDDGFDDIPF